MAPTGIVLAASVFSLAQEPALAATYYAATNGNDGVTCAAASNISTPKRTVLGALGCLAAGDTLLIRGGTYPEQISSNTRTIPTGTSWSAAVTIAGYPGETVILNPSAWEVLNLAADYLQYIVFKDLVIDGTNVAKTLGTATVSLGPNTHHLRFERVEVKNSPGNGIIGGGSYHEFIDLKVHDNGLWIMTSGYGPGANGVYLTPSNSVIDGGEYYNNLCYGVRFYNSDPLKYGDNNVVKNAKIHGNGHSVAFGGTSTCGSGGGGIVLGDRNNAAYNNLVYGNYWGLATTSELPVENAKFYNNTLYNNKYGISIQAGTVNTEVKNNIIVFPGGGFGIGNDAGSTVFSNNLCSAPGTGCGFSGDPGFADPASRDFRLQAGSPAENAGVNLYAAGVTADFDGKPRPQSGAFELGAFERSSSSAVADASPARVQGLRWR